MEEKELIAKLQSLKGIKPNQEWVSLTKREILGTPSPVVAQPAQPSVFSNVLSLLSGRKLAYALAALMVVFIGASGALEYKLYNDVKVANQSAADLLALKDNIRMFQEKSKILADVVEKDPQRVSQATKEVKNAVKKVADSVRKDPELAKTFAAEISHNNRVYLNIEGDEDLKQSVNDMYKTITEPLIKDLPAGDAKVEIEAMYSEGNYAGAFERILLFNINVEKEEVK